MLQEYKMGMGLLIVGAYVAIFIVFIYLNNKNAPKKETVISEKEQPASLSGDLFTRLYGRK